MMEEKIFRKNKNGIRKFFRMLWRARLPYLWIVLYIISTVVLTNVGLSVTQYTAEMFAGHVGLTTVVIPFLVVTTISLLIGSISGVLKLFCQARIDRNMRRMVWKKIVKLPYHYYDKSNPKELISRITTDISSVSSLIMLVFVEVITSSYSIIATLKKIGSYDFHLMIVLTAVLPINFCIALVLGKMNFGISDIVNKKNASLTEGIAESTENMLLIKSLGTERTEWNRGMDKAKDLYKKTVLNSWITSISTPAYAISGMIQFIIIVLVGRNFYSSGAITLAEWVAYFAFANNIVNYLSGYCTDWTTFKNSQGATNRITNLMLEEEEVTDNGLECQGLSGNITFSHVDFSYGKKELFHDLSFAIPEGKITAIVGPSGSGKTTILNLIERFYPINGGVITIGQDDIARYQLKSYRRKLGYITQETTLFSGTLKDNLLFGTKEHIDEQRIMEICKGVGIDDLISEDEKGLERMVGEDGMNFSGGQRQRIAIAQMLLKKPDYLLMDEATSAIDISGKDTVFESIRSELEGKTIVLVAHDRQTVKKAQHVIVLENGKVTGQGALEDLEKSNEFIQELMGEKRDEEEQ